MKNHPLKLMALWTSIASFAATSAAIAAPTKSRPQDQQSVASSTDVTLTQENRTQRKLGAYLGLLGDPHPTLVGFNIAYNLNSALRASLGFGKVSSPGVSIGEGDMSVKAEETSITTFGAAIKYMVPGWNLSPSAALGFSVLSVSDGAIVTEDYKSSNLYLGLGGDWQAASGFNLGAGLNISLNGGAPTAPYFNVGMFF